MRKLRWVLIDGIIGGVLLPAEQNVKVALRLRDRGHIIDNGATRFEGDIEALKRNEDVQTKYVLL